MGGSLLALRVRTRKEQAIPFTPMAPLLCLHSFTLPVFVCCRLLRSFLRLFSVNHLDNRKKAQNSQKPATRHP
jgi:hypothetical protein